MSSVLNAAYRAGLNVTQSLENWSCLPFQVEKRTKNTCWDLQKQPVSRRSGMYLDLRRTMNEHDLDLCKSLSSTFRIVNSRRRQHSDQINRNSRK